MLGFIYCIFLFICFQLFKISCASHLSQTPDMSFHHDLNVIEWLPSHVKLRIVLTFN